MQNMYAIAKGLNHEELQINIHELSNIGMIIFGMVSFDSTANCYSQPMRIDFKNLASINAINTNPSILPGLVL